MESWMFFRLLSILLKKGIITEGEYHRITTS